MNLLPYVENLQRELAAAAESGGDEALAMAERLTQALDSAARLTLLEALSAAADEITRELAPGSVDVRLRGRDPEFVVITPPPLDTESEHTQAESPSPAPLTLEADDGATSRITLRLPEHLKPQVEAAAAKEGISVNAWIVRAVGATLNLGGHIGRLGQTHPDRLGDRYTGWVR